MAHSFSVAGCRQKPGVKILKALELAVEELPVEPPKNCTSNVPAGTFQERVPFSVRRVDALALVAEASSRTAVRRLACDASVVTLIENDDGEPLNVGRKTRTVSAPLRRFLTRATKAADSPAVQHALYRQHHINHWANGGETKPSNLVSLCRFHHRAVHEGGFTSRSLTMALCDS